MSDHAATSTTAVVESMVVDDPNNASSSMAIVPVAKEDTISGKRKRRTTTSSSTVDENGKVHIDSLPYIDYFPEDYEAYALSLVEEEMKTFEPNPRYLAHLPPYDTSGPSNKLGSLTRTEYDEVVNRNGEPRPSSEQVNLVIASVARPPPKELRDDEEAWISSINKSKISLEQQRSRLTNLELQQEYEGGQWRLHNLYLENESQRMSQIVIDKRLEVDTLNALRKKHQEEAGPDLRILEEKWYTLIGKHRRLADATGLLEEEVRKMRVEQHVDVDGGGGGDTTKMDTTIPAAAKKEEDE